MSDEREISCEEAALSAQRAYGYAMLGLCRTSQDEIYPDQARHAWFKATALVYDLDGQTVVVRELAEQVRTEFARAFPLPADAPEFEPAELPAWEAVVCHLHQLLEGGAERASDLERSWADWVQQPRNGKLMATNKTPPTKAARPGFEMPFVEQGEIVLWYPDGDTGSECYPAVVTNVGNPTLALSIMSKDAMEFLTKDGVRHCDDPQTRKPEFDVTPGTWRQTPHMIRLRRIMDQLEPPQPPAGIKPPTKMPGEE